MREIEVKIKVRDLEEIKKKFVESGVIFSNPIHIHDTVYSLKGSIEEFGNPAKEGDTILRLRRLEDTAEFSLKVQKSRAMDSLEYETEVKSPEIMHDILLNLGYEPCVEVKKIRQKGKLGEYEVCLDEVEKLGSFVELEKLTDD